MFAAGKYFIGDLCYVISDWDAFCELTIKDEVLTGSFPWKGSQFWMHTTANGDGVYYDQEGHEYGVDAGLIGIIPIELCDESGTTLGRVWDALEPFQAHYTNGTFHFGDVEIATGPSSEYEDDSSNEAWCTGCDFGCSECHPEQSLEYQDGK